MHASTLKPLTKRLIFSRLLILIVKHLFPRIFLGVCMLLLNACSTFMKDQDSVTHGVYYDWPAIEQKLRKLNHWSLYGKLGIRTEEEAVTVAINKWEQADDQFEIDLSSTFFGLGSSKLFGSSDFLSIFQPGEETLSSFEPDTLIASALGIPFLFPTCLPGLRHYLQKTWPFNRASTHKVYQTPLFRTSGH